MDELSVESKLREIVKETIRYTGVDIEVDDSMSLVESGLLDSMSIVTLVQELQQVFDIDIDFSDLTISNFDSIDALVQYVTGRVSVA